MTEKFKFFSGVVFTKGYRYSLIIDLVKSRYKRFENSVYEEIVSSHDKDVNLIDSDLLHYFLKDSWGHVTARSDLFEPIDLVYETPNLIDNAILDYYTEEKYNIEDAIIQLFEMGCAAYQIRFSSRKTMGEIADFYQLLTTMGAEFIEFCLPYDSYDFSELKKYNARFYIYQFPAGTPLPDQEEYENIIVSGTHALPHENCGFVGTFSVNINHYLESVTYNTCLNKKVGIDADGNIKNCPSSGTIYGNINRDKLKDVVVNESFQKVWHISKREIETCKYCEFRNICTDCRIYTLNDDLYEKPKNCNYDPFKGNWA